MWLVLALVHFWKAENTWKTSLKMCKLFSVVNSTLASLPPSFKTVYVNMLSETAKPICNAFMLLLDTCIIPSILFHEVTCLQTWGEKFIGDPLKPWNNTCLDSAATESVLCSFSHTLPHFKFLLWVFLTLNCCSANWQGSYSCTGKSGEWVN